LLDQPPIPTFLYLHAEYHEPNNNSPMRILVFMSSNFAFRTIRNCCNLLLANPEVDELLLLQADEVVVVFGLMSVLSCGAPMCEEGNVLTACCFKAAAVVGSADDGRNERGSNCFSLFSLF